jgi:hypothetical protein
MIAEGFSLSEITRRNRIMADDQTLRLVSLSTREIIAPLSNTRVQEEIADP